jgi:hypothetical protein
MAPLGCINDPIQDKCGTCGGPTQPCCNGQNQCTPGNVCVGRGMGMPGSCQACGGAGQPCCNGGQATACMAPLGCVNDPAGDKCGTCGAMGQSCCNGQNQCPGGMGLVCVGRNNGMNIAGNCQPCGASGQNCCPGGAAAQCPAAGVGQGCITAPAPTGDKCGACGTMGLPCCGTNNAGTCTVAPGATQRLGCIGRAMGAAGTCAACGGRGQSCCGGNNGECTAQNRCVMGMCTACGAAGQVCCNAQGTLADCNTGFVCSGPSAVATNTCGTAPPGVVRDAGAGN